MATIYDLDTLQAEVERLKAENEIMRAALKDIANRETGMSGKGFTFEYAQRVLDKLERGE